MIEALRTIDERVAKWSAAHVTPDAVTPIRLVTELGGTATVVAAGAIGGLIAAIRARSLTPALRLALVIGGQNAVYNLIKTKVRRRRPEGPHLAPWAGTSFPSGHTATAAASWPAIAEAVAPGVAPIAAAARVAGPAVGATRVLLGVHWTTDVVAGLVLGWGWLALARRLTQRWT